MFLPSATSSQIEIMLHLGFESEQIPCGDDNQKDNGNGNGKDNGNGNDNDSGNGDGDGDGNGNGVTI
jgi:hypothetical protein